MRKYIKFKIIGLALVMAAFAACDTADQDVSPIVSPDGYPVATFTTDFTGGSVNEGDTIKYTIKFDKMIDRSVTFSLRQLDGDADDDDFSVASAVMQPYTKEVEMLLIINSDDALEGPESLKYEIKAYSLADKYLVNPSVVYPTVDLTITNVNDPTLLTIVFSFDTEDDIDIVTWSEVDGAWGDGGATGANPEVDKAIWLADPVGTYYVNIMHWGADPFDYTFTLGHPDGSLQTITGTFDSANLGNYTVDDWTAWGDSYPCYRVLKVVNNGTSFVVTAL